MNIFIVFIRVLSENLRRASRWVIHVIDNDPFSVSKGGWLENVDLVQKYEISEEDYNKRDKSYRKFKEEKLREDPNWSIEKEMAMKRGVEYKPPKVEVSFLSTENLYQGTRSTSRCKFSICNTL